MTLILVVLIVLLLCGSGLGYRAGWSPAYLGGSLGTVLVILIVLYLLGVFR